MTKIAVAITLMSILTISLFSVVQANFVLTAPALYIRSPHHASLEVYKNNTINIEIAVTRFSDGPEIQKISYSLDGHNLHELEILKDNQPVAFGPTKTGYIYYGKTVLNLAEGNYTLIAYATDENGRTFGDRVDFRIDLDYEEPTITFLSPLNQTYKTNELPLIYTLNGKVKYSYYILDETIRRDFQGNTTLTELLEGNHSLMVSALTESNNYVQKTANFSIAPTKTASSLNIDGTTVILGIVITIAVVLIVGLSVLRKKANQTQPHIVIPK